MKLHLRFMGLVVALFISLPSGFAIGSAVVAHGHETGDVISHGAPTDANGCHYGPRGYHCH